MEVQTGKHTSNFLCIFDNLLSTVWCERIYDYALAINRPWGAYVTTLEVLNGSVDADALWGIDPEKAISLVVTRKLFFEKGRAFLEGDIDNIHGILCSVFHCCSNHG